MLILRASAMAIWFAGYCGCPPGEEPSDDGGCRQCDAGYRKAAAGEGSCTPCAAGSIAPAPGAITCTLCSRGSRQGDDGQTTCDICPHPLSSREGGTECNTCDVDYYRLDATTVASKSTCIACMPGEIGALSQPLSSTACGCIYLESSSCTPSVIFTSIGAICPWNATISSLIVQPGYWRYSQEAETLYKCIEENSSNRTACIGGVPGSKCTRTHFLSE